MTAQRDIDRVQTRASVAAEPQLDFARWAAATTVATPYVAVHQQLLIDNLGRAAAIARAHGLALRPHVKTHKCIEIARLQLAMGACGITASKPQEALVFILAGMPSVTVAYPVVVPLSARLLLDAAGSAQCDLRFVVDSLAGVQTLIAALAPGQMAGVYLEIDVGLGRCGVKPGSAEIARIAAAIVRTGSLRFHGLLSHAGHAYAAQGTNAIAAIADDERFQMKKVAMQLAEQGIFADEISVGSTPTVLAATSFDGVTEIRPGNYVFLDLTACRLGVAQLGQVALAVVTTVVSVNDRYCIIDAGSKVLSSDTGPHGTGGGAFGQCFPLDAGMPGVGTPGVGTLGVGTQAWPGGRPVARLSEEHGFVEHGAKPLPIGTRALVFPNHSCPVANLAERLVVLPQEGEPIFWPVAARGKST